MPSSVATPARVAAPPATHSHVWPHLAKLVEREALPTYKLATNYLLTNYAYYTLPNSSSGRRAEDTPFSCARCREVAFCTDASTRPPMT